MAQPHEVTGRGRSPPHRLTVGLHATLFGIAAEASSTIRCGSNWNGQRRIGAPVAPPVACVQNEDEKTLHSPAGTHAADRKDKPPRKIIPLPSRG